MSQALACLLKVKTFNFGFPRNPFSTFSLLLFFEQWKCCLQPFQGMAKPYCNIIYTHQAAYFHFCTPSTYCLFREQYVHVLCVLFLISLVCICILYKLNVHINEFILSFPLLCSMLVYHRYTDANISPR